MAITKRRAQSRISKSGLRTSVSFPPTLYRTLEQIAKKKKVSIAWVVRDAAEKYVTDLYPLLEVGNNL